jgi:hypothetical protein
MTQRRLTNKIRTTLIAPCGMNCRLCRAYTRDRKTCPSCRGDDSLKAKVCVTCRIKNCEEITKGRVKYCFNCDSFPCVALNHLDNWSSVWISFSGAFDKLIQEQNLLYFYPFFYAMSTIWVTPSPRWNLCPGSS